VLIDEPGDEALVHTALTSQISYAAQISQAMGLGSRIAMLPLSEASAVNEFSIAVEPLPRQPASYRTYNDKRQTLRLAIDYLQEQLQLQCDVVALPAEAASGQVLVDNSSCTLCLACVTVCPARALQDGETLPQLKFIESQCLQCGLCEQACPEDAISLDARYLFDSVSARTPRVLNEEKPFNCVVCNKPFATERIIGRMLAKLSGHWMYTDESATRRLKMCEDCRVKDIFVNAEQGINVHRDS